MAPLTIDGALNGELFRRYVEQHLAPALHPGDLVVMDNLSSHKVAGVREALRNVGADVLYIPPYSPDFNPIEQAFSKLKTLIRKAKQRTMQGLWDTCGKLLDCFRDTLGRRTFWQLLCGRYDVGVVHRSASIGTSSKGLEVCRGDTPLKLHDGCGLRVYCHAHRRLRECHTGVSSSHFL